MNAITLEKDEKGFYKNVASIWKKCAISATNAGFEWSAPIDLSSYKENVPYTDIPHRLCQCRHLWRLSTELL